ncbi:MAG: hypothetical protein AMXMBFR64_59670 [Myxococcales bacterium]
MRAALIALGALVLAQCAHGRAVERVEETPLVVAPPREAREGIPRSQLTAILQGGPGMLLQQLQVVPQREGKRFVGFRIRTWFPGNPDLQTDRIRVGDVVVSVNGRRIERPDDLMALWTTLPTATELTVHVVRDGGEHDLSFPIVED